MNPNKHKDDSAIIALVILCALLFAVGAVARYYGFEAF